MLVLAHLGSGQLPSLLDLLDLFVSEANVDILRLEVCVDDLASPMDVIQTNQALSGKTSNKWQWDTSIVVSLYNLKEIYTQNLEDHDKVLSVGSVVDE